MLTRVPALIDRQRTEYHQIIRNHLSTSYLLSEEKIDSVLPGLLDTLQKLMHNLEEIAARETDEAVSRAGHAIKGALLNLGLTDLADKAFVIEKNCKSGAVDWNCSRFINELKEEIGKIT